MHVATGNRAMSARLKHISETGLILKGLLHATTNKSLRETLIHLHNTVTSI